MAGASVTVVGALAAAGIDAAKVAVLAVLGAMVAFAAAVWGTRKVLQLLGYEVPSGVVDSGGGGGLSTSDVTGAEFAHELSAARAESARDGLWIDDWSSASGTGDADYHKWRY